MLQYLCFRRALCRLPYTAGHFKRRNSSTATEQGKTGGILAEYHRLMAAGKLQPDPTQYAAVHALQLLQDSLVISAAARAQAADAAASAASSSLQNVTSQDGSPIPAQHGGPSACPDTEGSSSSSSSSGDVNSSPRAAPAFNGRPRVQGAYLWGPVGSGKTMLMDLFVNTLPPAVTPQPGGSSSDDRPMHQLQLRAHRVHYHEFMLAVHERLHQVQQSLPRIVAHSRAGLPVYRYALPEEDPLLVIARDAAAGTHLLCLDELHVTDVADAMLLSRLFGEVLRQGCMVVFTSNRPARDLYKGGLSRKYFEPFIQLIDKMLLQLRVAGGRDYRSHLVQQAVEQQGNWHHSQQHFEQADEHGPLAAVAARSGAWFVGSQAQQQLQQQWNELRQQLAQLHAAVGAPEDYAAGPARIPLPFGRTLWVPQALLSPQPHGSQQQQQQQPQLAAVLFTFEQICGTGGSRPSLEQAGALSANDYLALVKACPVIFIQGLPQLLPQQRDEARRLVTLVDILYEAHTVRPGSVKLFLSGDVAPHEVFLPLLGFAAAQGVNPNLGKAEGRLDVQELVREYGSTIKTGGDDVGAAVGEAGGSRPAAAAAGTSELHASLLPEEVLMYHRASSRLTELCTVVQQLANT